MKILLLASSFSGLCQRVLRELLAENHAVEQHIGMDAPRLREQIAQFQPDLIVCPFLTHRIPEDIWQAQRCLVVHPGIEGDRGPSSLDWAIMGSETTWGVTLLQAAAEMDAGDVWGTAEFPMRAAGKTSLYKREVSRAAVRLIMQAVRDAATPGFRPRPLDYGNPHVRGVLRDAAKQADRRVDWRSDDTQAVLRKLRAADTSPGVPDTIFGREVFLFGAVEEPHLRGTPGELLALSYGAACIATVDGAVWVRQMKCRAHPLLPAIKLPAAQVVDALAPPHVAARLHAVRSETPNDIRVEMRGTAACIHFDFYNGAASTRQCLRLLDTIRQVKRQRGVRTLVFMGGEDFFSNGIHLNCIEAAASPMEESWANIVAIDDVVLEIIDSPNHLTIAALRNNAGAGGAILPLACDRVVIRGGVVLNPHYENMGLYGSEYWTYLLPKRVGRDLALRIARECQPMLAAEALECGLADMLFEEDWGEYHEHLAGFIERVGSGAEFERALQAKRRARAVDEFLKPLELYRHQELEKMSAVFRDPDSRYHRERRQFVGKGRPLRPAGDALLPAAARAPVMVAGFTPSPDAGIAGGNELLSLRLTAHSRTARSVAAAEVLVQATPEAARDQPRAYGIEEGAGVAER